MEYQYRQVTPPSAYDFNDFTDLACLGGSASTNASYFPQDWSPDSVMTTGTSDTSPPQSPPTKIREIGPMLLPRVRPQDQTMESIQSQDFMNHGRTASLPVNDFPAHFGSYLPPRPSTERRSASPARFDLPTPGSAPLPLEHMMMDPASRRPSRPSISNARSVSSSNLRTHSRNCSSTSIDANVLGRYGFPTYRQSPTPQPMPTTSIAMSRTPSAMSHLAPIAMPNGQMQSYPARRRTASPPARPSRLTEEIEYDAKLDYAETSMLEYLTGANPTPTLTQRTVEVPRQDKPHMWFDVRNVKAWSDFNVSTMSAIPGLLELLNVRVSLRNLPTPGRVNLNPETPAQLAEMCAHFHAVKVNAALKLAQDCQGDKHMAMRTLQPTVGARQQPEFVSNYQSDIEKTIYGEGRGRVVGVVKCYDQWNSGMRNGPPPDQVKYLESLSLLHRFMREHGCRYGFIITEIELLCVRAGGPASIDSNVPLFGYLEVADPIEIASHGMKDNGNLQMTAGLALWYLHMLAKEQPFPGVFNRKMDVGGPSALTRQRHLPRDTWMPKIQLQDNRAAKRARGWVLPNEPLHKRECGRGRRGRT